MASLFIINARGEKEPLSFKKMFRSAKRAGASSETALRIAAKIKKEALPGITTRQVANRIRELLGRETPKAALRFNIKDAIRKLGPAGFAFEKYIGEIFERGGYEVKLNKIISGACRCQYEIDFQAKKGDLLYLAECKYHHVPGERSDLKVALANYARFLDISKNPVFKTSNLKSILITNTKFTSQAIKYSKCVGVKLLGWNYPRGKGLERLIEEEKLYPITILPSFRGYLKETFVQKRKMLVLDLLGVSPKQLAKRLKAEKREIEGLVREAKILLE